MIRLGNLNIAYDREILTSGKITIQDKAITVITGRSGSGKTSLLYRLGMISSDNSYAYYLDDKRININDKKVVSEIQQHEFGYLFQDGSLIDGLSIEDNIIFSAKIAGYQIKPGTIKKILHDVELSENVLKMYPSMLSGGELQRVSLAMILAKRTKYIFADEPTASLMLLGQWTFFTEKSLVVTLLLAILYVAVPSLISIMYISSLKVEKILRA